jgi:hypothetical protein
MHLDLRLQSKTGEKPGQNHAQNQEVKAPKTEEKPGQNRGASQPPYPHALAALRARVRSALFAQRRYVSLAELRRGAVYPDQRIRPPLAD